MIIHKLITHYARYRDDETFYTMQAVEAIDWIVRKKDWGGRRKRALDLGCGHGVFGRELAKRGWEVTYADDRNWLLPELQNQTFLQLNLDQDPVAIGRFDLVICSNVLEHLRSPEKLINSIPDFLVEGGAFYLSWTNWLSPWGGHEFSPFHYLGPKLGQKTYDALVRKQRYHETYRNLFPTYIGSVIRSLNETKKLHISAIAPRYYDEFPVIMKLPIVREFLAWNTCMLIESLPAKND